MLIKLLLSTPTAALLSYTFTSYRSIEFSAMERSGMEFILLGRIPGTEAHIEFEHLFIAFVILLWLPAVFIAGITVRKFIRQRIIGLGEQLELITL